MRRHGYPLQDYVEELCRDPEYAPGLEAEGRRLEAALQITKLREAHGLTQEQLAERVGTTQQTISRLESATYRGHSLRTLRRIAEALDAEVVVTLVPRTSAGAREAARS